MLCWRKYFITQGLVSFSFVDFNGLPVQSKETVILFKNKEKSFLKASSEKAGHYLRYSDVFIDRDESGRHHRQEHRAAVVLFFLASSVNVTALRCGSFDSH